MKLANFVAGGQAHWGAVRGDLFIDLNLARAMFLASRGREACYLAADALDFIRQGEPALDAAYETLEFLGSRVLEGIVFKSASVKYQAPLLYPPKIVAIGLNYAAHRQEQNDVAEPAYPVLFPKFPTSVIGQGESIQWDPAISQKVDYEGELGVVIGRRATRVSAAEALDYVFGYCNLNDVTARDVLFDGKGSGQWTRAKSFDTFCPIGPYIVTKDEVPDPQNLNLRTLVNGVVMQQANTCEMIASVAQLIEFITLTTTLLPGDVIATGTPPGVGHYRQPPVYLQSGDVVEVEVQGLGRLSNPIA